MQDNLHLARVRGVLHTSGCAGHAGRSINKMAGKKLSDILIRKLKPTEKRQKFTDGNGLILIVYPSGSKCWFQRCRIGGKEQTLPLGRYPVVGLAEARERSQEVRERLKSGLPPFAEQEAIVTLAEIAKEWLAVKAQNVSEGHVRGITARLERYILPEFGERDIKTIQPQETLDLLKHIAVNSGASTARTACQEINSIFISAVRRGLLTSSPAQYLSSELPKPKVEHRKARLTVDGVQSLFRMCLAYQGSRTVRNAVLLQALTATRSGTVRQATWSEIDFDGRVWNVPATHMKGKEVYRTPLSQAALDVLHSQETISGGGQYVFPARCKGGHRPLSSNAIFLAFTAMGIDDATPHGWRASLRSLGAEAGFSFDVMEAQLGHVKPSAVVAAYDRQDYLEARRKLCDWWANLLRGDLKTWEDVMGDTIV